MESDAPQHCRPEAYHLFREQLDDLDAPASLCMAAIAISMHGLDHVDPVSAMDEVRAIADRVRRRVSSGNPRALHAHAHDILFEEMGFRGSSRRDFDPRQSYLPVVLSRRQGLPILLCLLYKTVLEQVGISVVGLNAPGHFLVQAEVDGESMILDPFAKGRVLTQEEAYRTIEGVVSTKVPRSPALLPPASHRAWMARILQNLQLVFRHTKQVRDAAAIGELQRLLMRHGGLV